MSVAENRRARRAPILGASLHGVGGLLSEVFRPIRDLQVAQVPDAQTLEKALQQKQMAYTLPVIGYGVQSTSEGASAYNAQALRHGGAILDYDGEKGEYLVLKASSVELSVQVTLLTDSFETLWSFIELWHSREYWGFSVRLRDSHEGAGVSVSVTADKNLTVPTKSSEPGGNELYRMQGTLAVRTFAGFMWEVPDVRSVAVAKKFVSQGSTGYDAVAAFVAGKDEGADFAVDVVATYPRKAP